MASSNISSTAHYGGIHGGGKIWRQNETEAGGRVGGRTGWPQDESTAERVTAGHVSGETSGQCNNSAAKQLKRKNNSAAKQIVGEKSQRRKVSRKTL